MKSSSTPSLPGLTPQVGFPRLAALNNAELGQARVRLQSIPLRKKMDARVKPAHDQVATPALPLARRQFIALAAAAAAWPLAARAQQPGKTYRLGLLSNGPAVGPLDPRRAALLSPLSARGFAGGKNLVLLHRAAD